MFLCVLISWCFLHFLLDLLNLYGYSGLILFLTVLTCFLLSVSHLNQKLHCPFAKPFFQTQRRRIVSVSRLLTIRAWKVFQWMDARGTCKTLWINTDTHTHTLPSPKVFRLVIESTFCRIAWASGRGIFRPTDKPFFV